MQGAAFDRTHHAGAIALTASVTAAFKHTSAHALTRHFHQAKAADTANLNACAVVFQRIFHAFFDGAIVAVFVHINEIDDQKSGQITQACLAGNFCRGFQIGGQRGFLNRIFTC